MPQYTSQPTSTALQKVCPALIKQQALLWLITSATAGVKVEDRHQKHYIPAHTQHTVLHTQLL